MRRIKVVNKTHFQTKHLRAFIVRAANQVLDPDQKPYLTVEVTYNRGADKHGSCSGWAHLGGSFARVMLPSGKPDKVDFAHVCAHEIGHCKGLSHADMKGASLYQRVGSWREHYAWANELPLLPYPQKVKAQVTPADRAAAGLTLVQHRIKEWETRLKRAQTALKKYRAKEKYYSKRALALTCACAAEHTTHDEAEAN